MGHLQRANEWRRANQPRDNVVAEEVSFPQLLARAFVKADNLGVEAHHHSALRAGPERRPQAAADLAQSLVPGPALGIGVADVGLLLGEGEGAMIGEQELHSQRFPSLMLRRLRLIVLELAQSAVANGTALACPQSVGEERGKVIEPSI